MIKIQAITIQKQAIVQLIQFSALLVFSIFAPLLKMQSLTGPLVNATLFLSTVLLGVRQGILIGSVSSSVALSIGLLPIFLSPMIPFIIISNMLLVLVFDYLRRKNYWLGVVSASLSKFLFLFLTSSAVINFLVKEEMIIKLASIMGVPQLFTALTGGVIAFGALKIIKKV